MAITINSTDVTNHNHVGQDISPRNIYSENGITANTQSGTPVVANSTTDETSIYFQKNGGNVWAVGKGTGGIGDTFGFYSFAKGNVMVLHPDGTLYTGNTIYSGGDVGTSSGVSLNALYNATVFHKIVTASFSVDNIEIAPNSIVTVSIPNTQRSDGYERELMTISLGNASSSGVNSSCCTVYNQAVASGSASLAYIRNHSSSTARIAVYASVLYNYSKGASSFNSF